MKLTIGELRQAIREELERNLRWTAGFFGGNLSQPSTVHMPLPGLGATTEEENDANTGEHEEKEKDREDYTF